METPRETLATKLYSAGQYVGTALATGAFVGAVISQNNTYRDIEFGIPFSVGLAVLTVCRFRIMATENSAQTTEKVAKV